MGEVKTVRNENYQGIILKLFSNMIYSSNVAQSSVDSIKASENGLLLVYVKTCYARNIFYLAIYILCNNPTECCIFYLIDLSAFM